MRTDAIAVLYCAGPWVQQQQQALGRCSHSHIHFTRALCQMFLFAASCSVSGGLASLCSHYSPSTLSVPRLLRELVSPFRARSGPTSLCSANVDARTSTALRFLFSVLHLPGSSPPFSSPICHCTRPPFAIGYY